MLSVIPLPYKILILVVLFAATGGTGYYYGGKHTGDRIAADLALRAQVTREAQDLALAAAAERIGTIQVKNVTIRQKAETITREVPVYRDCKHTPDGLQLVNEALEAPGKPAAKGSVPGADTAH